MFTIRKSQERGDANHGWLKSKHTFSFGEYHEPKHMGFRSLRVINEDRIEGGTGFPTHGHRDMEIISYVIDGALEHQDSMGNKAQILPGEVQRMSAGTGVRHSEQNASKTKDTHFFQIWIQPNRAGLPPGYGQKSFEKDLADKKMVLVVSNTGRDGSIEIAQDADLYLSRPQKGDVVPFDVRAKRGVWIQVIRGGIDVNGTKVSAGDALSTEEAQPLKLTALNDAEFMLFDLA